MRCAWLALLPLTACLEAPPTTPPICGTARSLADEFDDPSSDRLTRYGPVSDVAEGRLLLQAGPDEYAGAYSNHWYRFDGGELTIALRSVDNLNQAPP